jgi:hypothetical protein
MLPALLLRQQLEQADKKRKILDVLYNSSQFEEWLSKFEQMGEIGKSGLGNEEPFIRFLNETTGLSCGLLDDTTLFVSSVTGEITLPSWVTRYLIKITQNGNKYGDSVTAKDCLSALS